MHASTQLAAWRDREGISQEALGGSLVPPVSNITVSRWETEDRLPSRFYALQLENRTGGTIPATAWGYSPEEIEAIRTLLTPPDAK